MITLQVYISSHLLQTFYWHSTLSDTRYLSRQSIVEKKISLKRTLAVRVSQMTWQLFKQNNDNTRPSFWNIIRWHSTLDRTVKGRDCWYDIGVRLRFELFFNNVRNYKRPRNFTPSLIALLTACPRLTHSRAYRVELVMFSSRLLACVHLYLNSVDSF